MEPLVSAQVTASPAHSSRKKYYIAGGIAVLALVGISLYALVGPSNIYKGSSEQLGNLAGIGEGRPLPDANNEFKPVTPDGVGEVGLPGLPEINGGNQLDTPKLGGLNDGGLAPFGNGQQGVVDPVPDSPDGKIDIGIKEPGVDLNKVKDALADQRAQIELPQIGAEANGVEPVGDGTIDIQIIGDGQKPAANNNGGLLVGGAAPQSCQFGKKLVNGKCVSIISGNQNDAGGDASAASDDAVTPEAEQNPAAPNPLACPLGQHRLNGKCVKNILQGDGGLLGAKQDDGCNPGFHKSGDFCVRDQAQSDNQNSVIVDDGGGDQNVEGEHCSAADALAGFCELAAPLEPANGVAAPAGKIPAVTQSAGGGALGGGLIQDAGIQIDPNALQNQLDNARQASEENQQANDVGNQPPASANNGGGGNIYNYYYSQADVSSPDYMTAIQRIRELERQLAALDQAKKDGLASNADVAATAEKQAELTTLKAKVEATKKNAALKNSGAAAIAAAEAAGNGGGASNATGNSTQSASAHFGSSSAVSGGKFHGAAIRGQSGPEVLLYPLIGVGMNAAYFALRRKKK